MSDRFDHVVPRELLSAPENRPKQGPRQVPPSQLQDEVPSMPGDTPSGLADALLETRDGPTLDGDRPDEPPQQVAGVVGDDLIGAERVAGQASHSRGTAEMRVCGGWRVDRYCSSIRSCRLGGADEGMDATVANNARPSVSTRQTRARREVRVGSGERSATALPSRCEVTLGSSFSRLARISVFPRFGDGEP